MFKKPYFSANFISTTPEKLTTFILRLPKPGLGRSANGVKTGVKEARRKPCFSFLPPSAQAVCSRCIEADEL